MLVLVIILTALNAALVVWIAVLYRRRVESLKLIQELLQAQEKERARLASELHDSLGQDLLIIKSRAEMGLRTAANPHTTAQLEEINRLCFSTMAEARQIAHGLAPRYLPQLGVTEALEALVDRLADSTPIRFQRNLDNIDDLFVGESALHVYRIVQEGLSNLVRHAQATEAAVVIERNGSAVKLSIEDNGRGFDPETPAGRRGLGLSTLQERVRILQGQVEIRTSQGEGTRINLSLPKSERRTGLARPPSPVLSALPGSLGLGLAQTLANAFL